MDIQAIMTAISTVGFPICSFFVCAYGLKYSFDKSTEFNNKSLEKIGLLTEAVNNNTTILTHLVEKLESSTDDGK